MVRDLVDDAFSTVELLKQDEACEFVRKGHGRKSNEFMGNLAHRLAKAERPANDEAGYAKLLFLNLCEQACQFLRSQARASFVKHQGQVVWLQGLQQAFALLFLAGFGRQASLCITYLLQKGIAPVLETLKIMAAALLQKRLFDLAHAEQMYGAFRHARLL